MSGPPDVEGLDTDEIYGMTRFHIVQSGPANVRYHHIIRPDVGDLHDHPWDYVTRLLDGCYREVTRYGAELYRAPCTLMRRAEHAHRLELPEGPCWTLIITGPARRGWGFWTDSGWQPWRDHDQRASA